jgi:hypothetical protein
MSVKTIVAMPGVSASATLRYKALADRLLNWTGATSCKAGARRAR